MSYNRYILIRRYDMKSIVIYSSLTGNTKQVAEAITSVLPADTLCVSMKELPPDVASYDLVFAGFWLSILHAPRIIMSKRISSIFFFFIFISLKNWNYIKL